MDTTITSEDQLTVSQLDTSLFSFKLDQLSCLTYYYLQTSREVMEGFAVDVGFGRSICVEAFPARKAVEVNSYITLPNSAIAKVSSRSVRIPLKSWKKLMDHAEELTAMFEKLAENPENAEIDIRIDLGRKLMIRAASPVNCLHIRKYYLHKENKEWTPGLPGVCLKIPELLEFMKIIPTINATMDIQSVPSCCKQENQEECEFCNPEGMYSDNAQS